MRPWKGNKAEKAHNMRANMWQACEKGTFAFYLHLFFSFFVRHCACFAVFGCNFLFFDILHAVWMLRHFCLLNFARTSSTAYHTTQDFAWFDGICGFQLVRLSLFRYRIQPFVERLIREQLTAALYRKAEPGSKPKPKIHPDISILPGASVKDVGMMPRKSEKEFCFFGFSFAAQPRSCAQDLEACASCRSTTLGIFPHLSACGCAGSQMWQYAKAANDWLTTLKTLKISFKFLLM